jgi:alpha-galactosidase
MTKSCRAEMKDDLLLLSTGRMTRSYAWQSGLLAAQSLRVDDQELTLAGGDSCVLPGQSATPLAAELSVAEIAATPSQQAHLAATVDCRFASGLELRRVFRLYEQCPAIACDYYVRRADVAGWTSSAARQAADLANVEQSARLNEGGGEQVVTEHLRLPGRHWRARIVDFADVTDRCNNLLSEGELLAYRADTLLTGNILLLRPSFGDTALFILKEAPCAPVQLGRSLADFVLRIGELSVLGLGLSPADAAGDEWVRGYSVVLGLSANEELAQLCALRDYQNRARAWDAARDEMIMMNTWGDRNQDTRMNEEFALREIDAAKRLGISHLQLDDGWQTGVSSNTGRGIAGSLEGIWRQPDYWEPRREAFPRGLQPVVDYGRKQGVEICLWFNPSKDDSYAHWQEDAQVLIDLHQKYAIRIFKIDGVQIGDKRAEINLRRIFLSARHGR